MREVFEDIYARNLWRYGSGQGSLPIHMRGYVRFVSRFIREHDIKSVVDVGCGDWQFSRFIDWHNATYLGVDIVASVISNNVETYASQHVTFCLADVTTDQLPTADLLLAKDVFQHWSNAAILRFLPRLQRYKFSLITNAVNLDGSRSNSTDITDGAYRVLDLRQAPFMLRSEAVFSITDYKPPSQRESASPLWAKEVLLATNDER